MPGRVFILGAGASREDTKHYVLPMPLSNDFFLTEYINTHWHNPNYGYKNFIESNLAKILSHYFGIKFKKDRDKIISSNSINIEEILTFLENFEKLYLPLTYQKDILIRAKQELLSYIHDVILYTPSHSSPEFVRRLSDSKSDIKLKNKVKQRCINEFNFHNKIISNIEEDDSIISFNWDLIVDSVLWANNKKHYFNLRDQLLNPFSTKNQHRHDLGYFDATDIHEGYFLKLHGSINLACCTNKECIRSNFPILLDEFEAEVPELYACNLCFSPIEILILPPIINKSYRSNRFFKMQAGLAAQKLQLAEEIIIIGYSFPIFDFEANSLMRLARLDPKKEIVDIEDFLEKIIIINPQVEDTKYVKRIIELFGIAKSKETHGHKVKLILYKSINEFIEDFIKK